MPLRPLHEPPDESGEVTASRASDGSTSPSVRVTVMVQIRCPFDTSRVTGRQIKDAAGVPASFALYRRSKSGNEPIADDVPVELRNGDHLFALPHGPTDHARPN